LAAPSLLLCVATAGLWIASYRVAFNLDLERVTTNQNGVVTDKIVFVSVDCGRVALCRGMGPHSAWVVAQVPPWRQNLVTPEAVWMDAPTGARNIRARMAPTIHNWPSGDY
jgi:hypothetical protein